MNNYAHTFEEWWEEYKDRIEAKDSEKSLYWAAYVAGYDYGMKNG